MATGFKEALFPNGIFIPAGLSDFSDGPVFFHRHEHLRN